MPTTDRVRASTDSEVNRRLDEERLQRVAALVNAPPDEITHALRDLDRAWDVERVLEANASTLILVSLALSRLRSPRWLALTTAVPMFLLQHAVQGWCPPIWVIRRLGVRTRRELDVERTAVKAIRGDFDGLDTGSADREAVARVALDLAERGH